jgi:hypothetical protein
MDAKQQKLLLAKLRQPIHINYIATYILKESEYITKEILNDLISQDIIVESKYAKKVEFT